MRQLIFYLLVSLGLLACTQDVSPPPPVLGPAVLTDAGVELLEWAYFDPNLHQTFPPLSGDSREFEDNDGIYEARLIEQVDGFVLVWGQVLCATQPVVVIHLDHTLEFWPGESVTPDCESMSIEHRLTIKLGGIVPLDEWTFTLHPPPRPES